MLFCLGVLRFYLRMAVACLGSSRFCLGIKIACFQAEFRAVVMLMCLGRGGEGPARMLEDGGHLFLVPAHLLGVRLPLGGHALQLGGHAHLLEGQERCALLRFSGSPFLKLGPIPGADSGPVLSLSGLGASEPAPLRRGTRGHPSSVP